jgi:uncharacterized membrane protein
MTTTNMTSTKLTTDRIVAIVFMALGIAFEIVWFVPSLMSIMITDSGTTPGREAGIYLMIFGPIVAVVAFAVTTIVLLALKRRAMITGIFTLVGPLLFVASGAALAFSGA